LIDRFRFLLPTVFLAIGRFRPAYPSPLVLVSRSARLSFDELSCWDDRSGFTDQKSSMLIRQQFELIEIELVKVCL
jgi:hypothetical protein